MGQELAGSASDRLIGEDHFVDAVEIPFVMGRHLVDPLGHSGVDIPRKDGHRPFVVAGTLLRVPGRGIAGTVVDRIQSRIIGHPAPCAAATDLPLVALPGLEARIRADRFAEGHGLLRIDLDLIVRPFGEGAPGLLAGLGVVGGDMALHAEFAAGNPDQDLVLDHQRRRGSRCRPWRGRRPSPTMPPCRTWRRAQPAWHRPGCRKKIMPSP